jgi:hypothetical protein
MLIYIGDEIAIIARNADMVAKIRKIEDLNEPEVFITSTVNGI